MQTVSQQTIAEQIAYTARLMFERRLTDISGGNVSALVDGRIYITPRYAGSKQHWRIDPNEVLIGSIDSDNLLSHPRCSRESKVHLAIYRNFSDVSAVIHAHPFHIQPFVVAEQSMGMVLEATQKFGSVDLIPFAPAHSQELADNVVAGLRGKEENIRKQAAAVLLPRHGIVVAGKDLLATLDALERIDWNAWCIIASRLLGSPA
jgi:L-fuculose-phosphate aldolase